MDDHGETGAKIKFKNQINPDVKLMFSLTFAMNIV